MTTATLRLRKNRAGSGLAEIRRDAELSSGCFSKVAPNGKASGSKLIERRKLMDVYLGADPGGVNKTGVAVFSPPSTLVSMNFSSVQEALNWYISQIKTDKAIAIGIDAPLSWSIGQSGWRKQDLHIRSKYSKYRSSVLCTNSLHGSCTVQGPLLAIEIKKQYKIIAITETHPKVTIAILNNSSMALPNLRFNRN